MGVKLHGMAHDVGHLIIAAIVQALHRMEDAALYGFQAIADMRHGTFEDDIRGVVEKPRLKHSRQLMLTVLAACCGAIVRMQFFGLGICICGLGIACRVFGIPDFFAGICVFVFFAHAVGFAGARAGVSS